MNDRAGKWIRSPAAKWLALLALTCITTGCEEPGDKVLSIDPDETAKVIVAVGLDRNANQVFDFGLDVFFQGVRVFLTPASGSNEVASGTTNAQGEVRFPNVPIGTYRVNVDTVSAGDSVRVSLVSRSTITVDAQTDSTAVVFLLEFATSKISDVLKLTRGRRVTLKASALNAASAFGDSTVHFADSTAAVRAYGLRFAITQDDTVRFRATVGERDGMLAITDIDIIATRTGALTAPTAVTTTQAAVAGGKLDNNLVQVKAAIVLDAITLSGGDVQYTVDDRSGPLDVIVDVNAGIATALPISRGAELDVTGVLVPRNDGSGRWRLKPRRTGDVIVRYLPITIQEARNRPLGDVVMVHGIALNDLNTFTNRVVHLSDATAAIRAFPAGNPLFLPGDSISVLGTITIGQGDFQRSLAGAVISVLARRTLPAPVSLTTLQAANAQGGTRDAAYVQVDNATVAVDTARLANGSMRFTVNDTTGPVVVVLEPQLFGNPPITMPRPGSKLRVAGLLTPTAPGVWAIRPRSASEVVVR